MGWRQFVMDLQSLEPECVEALFTRHGAHAVTLSDGGDDPVLEPAPGEMPLWGNTRITGLFDSGADLEPLKRDLCRTFGLATIPPARIEILADRVWEREWLRDFKPLCFGRRLWVCPHDSDAPAGDAVVIRLDPGLAFGTGTHATTALCLAWLDSLELAERSVLDVGCGSGILAIGALLLGADHATAYDIDRQAVTATLRNAAQNAVLERLTATRSIEELHTGYDVVVANILAEPLIRIAPDLAGRVRSGGVLGLSGILAKQVDIVRAAYGHWIEFNQPVVEDGWACLTGTRR